jgi:hypothetical protein
MRKLASGIYLLTAALIGLGAFGHGSHASHLAELLAKSPAIEPPLAAVLIAVWYFVSGCMLVFAAIAIHTWLRARRGERGIYFASDLIGAFYVIVGATTVAYTRQPFFLVFLVLGILLIASSWVIRRPE